MAIVQTGSTLTFAAPGSTNTGTVSTTITVPADAEIVVVGWSGYGGTANYFSGGVMQFTKGGVDTNMVSVAGGDANIADWQGALFYLALPDTGTNKTLKWDWSGTADASSVDTVCSVTFWKGINSASPVRGSSGGQAAGIPYTSGTVTALSGDLIIAWAFGNVSAEGTINSWSNLSLLTQIAMSSGADAAWATGSPSGNTTVAASTATNFNDGGIVAISLKPAAAGTLVVGWMPEPEQVWPKRAAPFDTRPALALTPATLPPKISGMAWFEPPDRQPKPPPRFEPGPALALTPATLPPKIAGMAWFEPPDVLPRRGPVFDTARAFIAPVVTPVVTVPQGWAPVPDVLPRRRVNALDVLAFVPTPDIAVGRGLGWFVPPEAVWLRKFLATSDPPALGGITIVPVPFGWLIVPEAVPSRRALLSSDPTFVFATTAPAPTPISGMAWFIPPEPFRARPVIWVTAPSWAPQQFAFVPPPPVTEIHNHYFFADVGRMMSMG